MTISFYYFLAFIALLVGGCCVITRKWDDAPPTALKEKSDDINQLTAQYNEVIKALEDAYYLEQTNSWNHFSSSSRIEEEYSQKYIDIRSEYLPKVQMLKSQWERKHPLWGKARTTWGWIFVIGLISGMFSCFNAIPGDDPAPAPVSRAASSTETTYWNADNIPIPHLQDASQYVSNPDYVLAQATVDSMNVVLQRLDSQLGIESVVIVVNHIENDDPFRMAQDVGNKYGVGRNDRGLVVVCGYQDHSINMSPGRSLEADLTDAECHRLQQQYVIPAMRADQPDSAMLYLTKAIYAVLQKKELPQMTSLMQDNDDDAFVGIFGLYMLFFVGWLILFSRLNRKYQWMGLVGAVPLLNNPFRIYERAEDSFGGGGGFGGFSGGGGGFSGGGGGSFGGGSFGGGGATSRW